MNDTPLVATSTGVAMRDAMRAAEAAGTVRERDRHSQDNAADWARNRRMGHAARGFGTVPAGGGPGRYEIWHAGCHNKLVVCRRGPHLVCMEEAVKAANKRPGPSFRIGDGCGAPSCKGRTARLARYRDGQRRHAAALASGRSDLIGWPAGPAYDKVWVYPPETAAIVAAAAICTAEALGQATPAAPAPRR